jgi:O-acetyl-ADP-ribose deacetylase (regulator of RNase III)
MFDFREGDITQLRADAIVHSTNETLSDRNPLSDRLFSKAGPGLRHEIQSEIKGNFLINIILGKSLFVIKIKDSLG